GVGDGVQQRVGAEVGAGRLDAQAELRDEVLVVDGPLGSGDGAWHPDAVPDQLMQGHGPGWGQCVGGAGEQLERLVEYAYGFDVVGQGPAGCGDGAEGRVDRAGADGGDGRGDVEDHDDVEVDVRVGSVESAHQA